MLLVERQTSIELSHGSALGWEIVIIFPFLKLGPAAARALFLYSIWASNLSSQMSALDQSARRALFSLESEI